MKYSFGNYGAVEDVKVKNYELNNIYQQIIQKKMKEVGKIVEKNIKEFEKKVKLELSKDNNYFFLKK